MTDLAMIAATITRASLRLRTTALLGSVSLHFPREPCERSRDELRTRGLDDSL